MANRASLGGLLLVVVCLSLPAPFVWAQAAGRGQPGFVRGNDCVFGSHRGQQERIGGDLRAHRVGGDHAADGALALSPRDADFVVQAPGSWTGSTCGAGDDCGLCDTEDVAYEIIIPEAGIWTFSLCGSSYDTVIYLGTGQCLDDLGANDDYCGLQSQLALYLAAGDSFLEIEGFCCGECGEYVLDIFGVDGCDLSCPPDAVEEPEPCGEDTNGGCTHDPHQYSPIECNQTVCGTAWSNYSYRDTDWYEVTVNDDTTFTWSACAEFPVLLFVFAGPEDDYQLLTYAMADPPTEARCSADVAPGTYWVLIGPSQWFDLPCDAHYVAHLSCTPLCAGTAGDVNGDGATDNFDITPFVYALTHTHAEFLAEYPEGHYGCADANADGYVDNFDITPFVALLSGG